jgi:cytochrome c oxidase cbb3-type subunit 3
MLRMMGDTKWMALGANVFKNNCTACHGASAQGIVGPNLTDDAWKNVKVLTDIPRVIANGAAGGAMPAWKTRLEPNELVLVASYVASLRGKNVPGKPPEGEIIPPWPTAPAASPAPTKAAGT